MSWQRWRFAISVSWPPWRAPASQRSWPERLSDCRGEGCGAHALSARNHALVDGNKRLAWAATRVLCLLNGRDLAYAVDDAEAVVLGAAGGELDVHDLAQWMDVNLR